MGIHFINKIMAFGPEDQLVRMRKLIDKCSRFEEGENRTYFHEIFGQETARSIGLRWESVHEQDGCIWVGEGTPPTAFLGELSARFPEVIFKLLIHADDVNYVDIYEYRRGISVRRGLSESSSDFEAVMERRRRLLKCVVEHLNENTIKAAQRALIDEIQIWPHLAEMVLLPIFEISDFWPEFIAKETLGIVSREDMEIDELIKKFEALDSSDESDSTKN